MAEVFSCPHTQEYSPASSTVSPWISSSHTAPSCLRRTLAPALRVSGRLAQLTAQYGCGPFCGLFLLQTFCELGRQGCRWSERHKHITRPELTEATGYREYTETQNPTGPDPPAGVPAHTVTIALKGPAVHVPRNRHGTDTGHDRENGIIMER